MAPPVERSAGSRACRAGGGRAAVEVTVAHLASPERAEMLATKLAARVALVAPVRLAELGAVLGAHVGPGMVAVCVTPAIDGAVPSRTSRPRKASMRNRRPAPTEPAGLGCSSCG
uniref:DegV family protein n=1 Tax=Nocardioides alcanivorans TaxID=2897352 RepID=UPI0028996409|nr:DegV family protein [Nocardioides alcanivorans]